MDHLVIIKFITLAIVCETSLLVITNLYCSLVSIICLILLAFFSSLFSFHIICFSNLISLLFFFPIFFLSFMFSFFLLLLFASLTCHSLPYKFLFIFSSLLCHSFWKFAIWLADKYSKQEFRNGLDNQSNGSYGWGRADKISAYVQHFLIFVFNIHILYMSIGTWLLASSSYKLLLVWFKLHQLWWLYAKLLSLVSIYGHLPETDGLKTYLLLLRFRWLVSCVRLD